MDSILDLIPYGKNNAITCEELERLTGKEDRTNRIMLKAECKKHNIAVISLSQGKGYYKPQPKDIDAVEHQINQNTRKAVSILENNKPLENWLKTVRGQQSMSFEDNGQRKMDFAG